MGSLVTAAKALADQLLAANIPATHNPTEAAATKTGVVYIEPPTINYVGGRRGQTWRLVALSGQAGGTLAALHDLDQLVQAVAVLLPIESATYATYQLAADRAPFPAYLLTLTT